ncbi:MAG: glutathione S-transferase [Gammaproteobacteria bacterium]|jgi:glutathione S-transferase|nr:glutathione S-transferase [Gammaproteobacteria bacterium]MBQ0774885.1 glutathione S-transferase [Gammaproteobacteria bacterium]|tara:strand:+ start:105192 stop:105863 length:672 start_codon:yes stop_codon:yes gene_type:complete
MLIVHHLNNSRSQRVLWLLEELGVPYEIKHYQRDAKTMLAPAELKAVHPLGKSPVITDGDQVIAESGAIIEYLCRAYGNDKVVPSTKQGMLDYSYFLHYAEGSAMPLFVMKLIFGEIPKRPMPFFVRPIARALCGQVIKTWLQPQINTHLAFLEQTLQASPWFAGSEFSAADIQMSFPIEAAAVRDKVSTKYPALNDYLRRIHERPAYKRALERGGPYNLMGG